MESEFQFIDFSTVEFKKIIPTGISGIENGIGILLPMGVPEIGTEKWNSQPRQPALLKQGNLHGALVPAHCCGRMVERFDKDDGLGGGHGKAIGKCLVIEWFASLLENG